MKISQLNPSRILDKDQINEVIHFDVKQGQSNGFFYTKYRYLSTDFKGNPISDKDNYIRTKSLWYTDLINGKKQELVPFGFFDISKIYVAQNYVYFLKIVDFDGDGILNNEDYLRGNQIWRVHKTQSRIELCFDCKGHNAWGIETGNDEIIVFRSEDDDFTELVFIDISNQRKASLLISHDDSDNELDFMFVADQNCNPSFFMTKRWVFEVDSSKPNHTLNCITWDDLLKQLDWKKIL